MTFGFGPLKYIGCAPDSYKQDLFIGTIRTGLFFSIGDILKMLIDFWVKHFKCGAYSNTRISPGFSRVPSLIMYPDFSNWWNHYRDTFESGWIHSGTCSYDACSFFNCIHICSTLSTYWCSTRLFIFLCLWFRD